jgi:hypothetical protein
MRPQGVLLAAAACIVALAMPRLVIAQGIPFPGGHSDNPNGPTVSPYLNLLQNNSQGFNSYQTMVKPIIDQNSALQRQGGAIQQLQQQVNNPAGGGRRGTGHATYFMNYSHFYTARSPRR